MSNESGMECVSKAQLEFAIKNKVVIQFYSDAYGKNVRTQYSTTEGVEHGFITTVGMKRRSDGKPHTVESAIAENLQTLLESST